MVRPLLLLPVVVALLTGCTISARANPIDPTSSPVGEATAVALPAVAPDVAVAERLTAAFGGAEAAMVTSITANGGAAMVTLALAPSTLGGAEQYWAVCSALTSLLGSSPVSAVSVIAPSGRAIVTASVNSPSCALATP